MSEQKQCGASTARPVVLAIGGIDPGGGAGLIADVRAIHEHGCWPAAVPTAHTVQTYGEVRRFEAADGSLFSEQLEAVIEDHELAAIKVGMLPNADLIGRLREPLTGAAAGVPVVLDPVLRASSGASLSSPGAISEAIRSLLPHLTLLTPNRQEAERLCGLPAGTERGELAESLRAMGAAAVVITGGHADGGQIENLLWSATGRHASYAASIRSERTHGTGCLFSSAVAARLAHGATIERATEAAHGWVSHCVARGQPFKGAGGAPTPSAGSSGGSSR